MVDRYVLYVTGHQSGYWCGNRVGRPCFSSRLGDAYTYSQGAAKIARHCLVNAGRGNVRIFPIYEVKANIAPADLTTYDREGAFVDLSLSRTEIETLGIVLRYAEKHASTIFAEPDQGCIVVAEMHLRLKTEAARMKNIAGEM